MTDDATNDATNEPTEPPFDPLERVIHPRRVARIDHVLAQRLASVTVVFEDIYDPHNVGAGMRTADGYGLSDVHVVTAKHGFKGPGSVAKSAEQWLTVHRHGSPEQAIAALRAQGFSIWVSDLDAEHALAELPVQGKIALVIGNEAEGISEAMRQAADVRYVLPMHGMVQSFNLSVALAISLERVAVQRRNQLAARGRGGDLPAERAAALRPRWLEYGVRQAKKVRAAYAEGDPEADAAIRAAQREEAALLAAATARVRVHGRTQEES